MCNPVVMAGMMVMSSVMSSVQQNQMASAQMDSANANLEQQQETLMRQMDETNDKARVEQLERYREGMRMQSAVSVAVGESGVGGVSANRTIQNEMTQAEMDIATLEANRVNAEEQFGTDLKAVQATHQNNYNSAKNSQVGFLTGALKAGMAGASGYAMGSSFANAGKAGSASSMLTDTNMRGQGYIL